jgi:hypothetical protein
MVVIQAEESSKVEPPTSRSEPSRSANANRDASDGFETASDTDLPSDDDGGNSNNNNDGGAISSGGDGPPQAHSDQALNDDDEEVKQVIQRCNLFSFNCFYLGGL